MKVIYGNRLGNLYCKWCGFSAANIFGVAVYAHPNHSAAFPLSASIVRHEGIHQAQMKELWFVGMWVLTGWYFVRDYYRYGDLHKAYRNSPFEQEAYNNSGTLAYVERRERFAWKKFV
jgi:hypothetical protein